jgi:antagonist of KipI
MALQGPELRAEKDGLVALCGAGLEMTVGGVEVPSDRPVVVAAGDVLIFSARRTGARAWLAFAGGLDVPVVQGSRSTYVRGRMGGYEGRPLIAGDTLETGEPSEWALKLGRQLRAAGRRHAGWSVRPETLGRVDGGAGVRVVRGPEWDLFTPQSQHTLFNTSYAVTKDADRMGMRLEGAGLALQAPREEISSGMNVGVVQVPPSGQPIVLLVGRQSVGGYPRIAAVAAVDLGQLAQFKPGDRATFREISIVQAHRLLLARERDFLRVKSELVRMVA